MIARGLGALLLAALLAGPAAAQATYGQCQDRAQDRFLRDQANPAIGGERARSGYIADMQSCQRLDAQNRASDARADQQRLDQQRFDQQRQDQQQLDQLRARQRDDMLRNRR